MIDLKRENVGMRETNEFSDGIRDAAKAEENISWDDSDCVFKSKFLGYLFPCGGARWADRPASLR